VTVRRATPDDRELLRQLWTEFTGELETPELLGETWEQAWPDVERHVRQGVALVAEAEDGEPVGFALANLGESNPRTAHLTDMYVRPAARRRGLAKELLAAVAAAAREAGFAHLTLEVASGNAQARAVYDRLGFREVQRVLASEVEALATRLETPAGDSFGSVHAQTDDLPAVERAVRQVVPRLGRSGGSVVAPPRNGWIGVYDELCDRDPSTLRRLARELSDRFGVVLAIGVEAGAVVRYALLDRGRIVDEYLSVPEFHGPLPPGDAVALRANPTVVARVTGADPSRVRAVARTAASPGELPPAPELATAIGEVLGVDGVGHGVAGAAEIPGAVEIRWG
jgi:ribosomal protein S18 acetylase RimI-like enzyme